MIESHDYPVQLTATSPKSAVVSSAGDGLDRFAVASPAEFGGPGRTWSPEHLFVAAISSCLMTTFHVIADISGIEVLDYKDDAVGHLQRGADRLYKIDQVTLKPRVLIGKESDVAKTQRLLEKAKTVCLISRSVASDIQMKATVLVADRVDS